MRSKKTVVAIAIAVVLLVVMTGPAFAAPLAAPRAAAPQALCSAHIGISVSNYTVYQPYEALTVPVSVYWSCGNPISNRVYLYSQISSNVEWPDQGPDGRVYWNYIETGPGAPGESITYIYSAKLVSDYFGGTLATTGNVYSTVTYI